MNLRDCCDLANALRETGFTARSGVKLSDAFDSCRFKCHIDLILTSPDKGPD